jgi:hypothetical protein
LKRYLNLVAKRLIRGPALACGSGLAFIAQRIELGFPKPCAQVQVLVGALY